MSSTNGKTSKVLRPAHLVHVVLRTNNLQAMNSYYKTFLDAEVAYENDHISFLTYDNEHHRIALVQMDELAAKNPMSNGLDHISFAFNTLHDLATAYRQRKEYDIVPWRCINHGPTTSIYYKDPDGNTIETQVDNFDTPQEADAFMKSKYFANNPIGVYFDPEELVRRLASGEDETIIKRRVETAPVVYWDE